MVYKDKEIITCYKQWSLLQVYTSKLKEERKINRKNEENTEKFTIENPRGMSVDSDGNLYITDSNTHHLFKFKNLVISETFQNSVILLKIEITSNDHENIPLLIERHYGTYIQGEKSPDEDIVNQFKIVCRGFIFVSNDCTKKQSLKRYTKQSTNLELKLPVAMDSTYQQ